MFEGLERVSAAGDWVTIFLVAELLMLSILQYNFKERFYKLFSLIYSEKYYTDFIKTRPLIFNWFHVLFFFIININISLLLFFVLQAFDPGLADYDLRFFLRILILSAAYFSIRYILGSFLGNLFNLSERHSYFTFLKISNLSLIVVLILPLLILSCYSVGIFHKFWITLTLVASVALALFRYFVLIKNEKLDFNNLFYLFLYLCALELAPFIVIYKLFVD